MVSTVTSRGQMLTESNGVTHTLHPYLTPTGPLPITAGTQQNVADAGRPLGGAQVSSCILTSRRQHWSLQHARVEAVTIRKGLVKCSVSNNGSSTACCASASHFLAAEPSPCDPREVTCPVDRIWKSKQPTSYLAS